MSLQFALCYGIGFAEEHVFESTMRPHLMTSYDKLSCNWSLDLYKYTHVQLQTQKWTPS